MRRRVCRRECARTLERSTQRRCWNNHTEPTAPPRKQTHTYVRDGWYTTSQHRGDLEEHRSTSRRVGDSQQSVRRPQTRNGAILGRNVRQVRAAANVRPNGARLSARHMRCENDEGEEERDRGGGVRHPSGERTQTQTHRRRGRAAGSRKMTSVCVSG